MKILTLLIIVGLCFGVSGFAPITLKADNIKDAYKVFSFFHGKWQQEIEIEGTKTIEQGKCEGSVGDCNIWGLQYHPEITYNKMINLIIFRKEKLLARGAFKDQEEIDKHIEHIEIENQKLDKISRMRELENWLDYLNLE